MYRRSKIYHRSSKILGGTPVFRGTRVPVKTLIDYLEKGDRLEDFLEDFPTVTHDQVVGFLKITKESLLDDAGTS